MNKSRLEIEVWLYDRVLIKEKSDPLNLETGRKNNFKKLNILGTKRAF